MQTHTLGAGVGIPRGAGAGGDADTPGFTHAHP